MKKVLVFLFILGWNTLGVAQNSVASDSAVVDKKKLRTVILAESAFYVGGMSYLQFVWYKDKERVPFHFYDDSKGYQQIDNENFFLETYQM